MNKLSQLMLAALCLAAPSTVPAAELVAADSAPHRVADEPVDLVPALHGRNFHLEPGPRPYRGRLSFSPGFGALGTEQLYLMRVAYNPANWYGYEASLGHNPSGTVHALFNKFSVVLRRPMPWRLQPFVSTGYGMVMVFPGQALIADSVTKNSLSFGGGLELFLRDDLALRVDLRGQAVFGNGENEGDTAAYTYREISAGLQFYRSLERQEPGPLAGQ